MLLFFSILVILSILSTKISVRYGLPLLLLFVLIGFIAGSDVLNIIYFDNATLTKQIADILLIFIIFDGGFRITKKDFRSVAGPALSLATLGVALTAVVLGLCIHFILKIELLYSMMLASIISSTDAAAVQMITKQYPIKSKLSTTLNIESAANDPMAILLTGTFLQILAQGSGFSIVAVFQLVWQFAGGLAVGFIGHKLSLYIIDGLQSDNRGNYSVLILGLILLSYSLADLLRANGIIAVFFMGYWMGNKNFTAKKGISNFLESISTMCNVALFLMLGLLAFPSRFIHIWKQGLIIVLIMMFIARPAAVFVSTIPFKYGFKEKLFLAWGGIKGVVPIVLATYPSAYALDKDGIVFDVIFFAVFLSCIIQGTTLGVLSKIFRFTAPRKPLPPYTVELHAMTKTDIEMFEIHIAENVACVDRRICELDLGDKVSITAIIRRDKIILPKGNVELKGGDTIYILSSAKKIDEINNKLNAPRGG